MAKIREILYPVGDTMHYELISDNADIHNENVKSRYDNPKGFTPERSLQHIGSVPCEIWHAHAKKVGFYDMDKEKRKEEIIRFLNSDQYRVWATVEKIRTEQPNESNIFVK